MQVTPLTFEQLTATQLYGILQLRQAVFIEEQQSIYNDIDGLDQSAIHWCVFEDNQLTGYARSRCLLDSRKFKIERVVNHAQWRGKGIGKLLINAILSHARTQRPAFDVELSAQLDVLTFYCSFGFQEFGEPYDDGGILHKSMRLSAAEAATD